MAEAARFCYVQARLQARHGQRPSAADWQALEASVDLLHFLDGVRATSLKRWVQAVSADSSAMEIESLIRMAWRDAIAQSVSWAPEPWREALRCLSWLPDLPALDHLMSGGEPAAWMHLDPIIRTLVCDDPTDFLSALEDSPLAPMEPALRQHQDALAAWLKVWRQRQPHECSEAVRSGLDALVAMLQRHRQGMAAVEAEVDGQDLRADLAERLTRMFRRGAGTQLAVLAFLGLEALELERIRADLLTRRLLRQVAEGRSWA